MTGPNDFSDACGDGETAEKSSRAADISARGAITDNPRRGWWRLHVATLLGMFAVVAALTYLNATVSATFRPRRTSGLKYAWYGWPMDAVRQVSEQVAVAASPTNPRPGPAWWVTYQVDLIAGGIIGNVLLAACLILATGITFELWLRERIRLQFGVRTLLSLAVAISGAFAFHDVIGLPPPSPVAATVSVLFSVGCFFYLAARSVFAAIDLFTAWPTAEVKASILRWGAYLCVILTCLYSPFAWLLYLDYPWNGYRWFWIKLWPILPGFIPGMFFHPHQPEEFVVMGLVTIGILLVLVRTGYRNRIAFAVGALVCLVWSAVNSWIAYRVFWS